MAHGFADLPAEKFFIFIKQVKPGSIEEIQPRFALLDERGKTVKRFANFRRERFLALFILAFHDQPGADRAGLGDIHRHGHAGVDGRTVERHNIGCLQRAVGKDDRQAIE